jgi:hypothetical protein
LHPVLVLEQVRIVFFRPGWKGSQGAAGTEAKQTPRLWRSKPAQPEMAAEKK